MYGKQIKPSTKAKVYERNNTDYCRKDVVLDDEQTLQVVD